MKKVLLRSKSGRETVNELSLKQRKNRKSKNQKAQSAQAENNLGLVTSAKLSVCLQEPSI